MKPTQTRASKNLKNVTRKKHQLKTKQPTLLDIMINISNNAEKIFKNL